MLAPAATRPARAWGPPLAALVTPTVLLAAWWVPLTVHGAGAGLLLDVGRVVPAEDQTTGAALLVGRIGDLGAAGAPWWAGAVPLVLAVVALVPRSSRAVVLGCWLAGLVVAGLALVLTRVPLEAGGAPAAAGLGVLLVAWQACLVTAAVLGGQAVVELGRTRAAPTLRTGVAVVLGLAAVAAPVVGLAWAVLPGSAGLDEDPVSDVPAYMVQSAGTGPEHGVLVVRGSVEDGLTYEVLRDDGIRLGEDEVIDLSAEDAGLRREVQALVSRPRSATVTALAAAGVEYVVLPDPADGRVAAGLDAVSGLLQASAEDRATRAWQVDRELDPAAVEGPGSWWRIALLVIVLPGPARRARPGCADRPGGAPVSDLRPRSSSHRRAATRGPRPVAAMVLTLLVPVLAVLALLLVRPTGATVGDHPPRRTELTRSSVLCPTVDAPVLVGTDSGRRGEVSVRLGASERDVAVGPGRLSRLEPGTGDPGPAALTGLGAVAPGLVVGRYPDVGPLAAPTCGRPLADQWFTGVGAGARHSSVLELVNPDAGPAVIDTVVYGPRGELDVPALRGVSVPGRGSVRLDLAEVAPRRGDLALRVTTSRGRVGASVLDRFDELGAGPSGADWLPAQTAPRTSTVLLGVVPGEGSRTLVLANTSTDQARATLRVLTADATFAPEGVEDVVVAPSSTVVVDLADVLTPQVLPDAAGIVVESTRPVTATTRTQVGDDLSLTTAGESIAEGTTAGVLPAGEKRFVVAAAGAGSVEVVSRDAAGRVLDEQRADLLGDRAVSLDLPEGARLAEVRLRGTSAVASVVATGAGGPQPGATVVGLRPLETNGLIPDVRPAGR